MLSAVIDWNGSQTVLCLNTLLNMLQNIGKRVVVAFWRLPTLRRILENEFYAVIHVKPKNGETLDTVLLKPFGKRVAGLFQVPSVAYNVEQGSLYPIVSP